MLSKSGHIDLSFNEIYQSSGLAEWEEWMYAKVMKTDEKYLVKLFEKVFTNYLNGLMSSIMVIKGTIMTEIWCHPGKTVLLASPSVSIGRPNTQVLEMNAQQILSTLNIFSILS